MAVGYGWSIIVMMAAPFVVIGVLAAVIVRNLKRGAAASRIPEES